MTRRVRFRPEAEAEAIATRLWYDQRSRGLGDQFVAELRDLVSRVSENPEQFRKVRGQVRRALLNRFPYALYFRADGESLVVLAVHGRQHPHRWQSRE